MFSATFPRVARPPFGPALAVTAAAPYTVYDTFTGVDGTLLTAHTPDVCPAGSAWENITNSYQIQSNRATGQGVINFSKIDSGISDCRITANIYIAAGDHEPGIMFRFQDTSHYWMCDLYSSGRKMRIFENTGGFVVRAEVDFTPRGVGQSYILIATLSGPSISLSLTDGPTVAYSSTANQTSTFLGLWNVGNFAPYDSYLVEAI